MFIVIGLKISFDYYPNKIIENGMQATDLMYFKKSTKLKLRAKTYLI